MEKINLIGSTFKHAYSSTWWKKPKHLKWEYDSYSNPITVYVDGAIDQSLNHQNDGKIKYGWLLESKYISPLINEKIKNNPQHYLDSLDGIFTCDEDLLKLDERFLWSPAYGVSVEEYGGKEKNKLISMISSNKQLTPQQRFRVNFINQNRQYFDLFGNGYNPIKTKNSGLDNYMFSVSIENGLYDTYFTEKILDCFATKTIPLYLGSRKITNYFNKKGIIFLEDIDYDLSKLSKSDYFDRIDYITENYNKVKKFDILDDWIYKKYIK
jgi:hypothetical protein